MLRHSGPQCVCSYIFRAGNANVCFRPHFLKLDAEDLKNSTDVATYYVALEATEHHVESDDTFDKGPCTNDVSLIFGNFEPPLPLSEFIV